MINLNQKTATLLLAATLLCSAASGKSKLSDALKSMPRTPDLVQIIVQWNPEEHADSTQKILDLGGIVVRESPALNMGTYLVPALTLKQIGQDSAVKHVSAEQKVHRKLAAAAAAVGAPTAWKSGFTGAGIGVAVIDSGINDDDNLNNNGAVYTEDFSIPVTYNKDGKLAAKPQSYGVDWYGHGQHVAGIIASNGKASTCGNCTASFVGLAPGSNLIDLKVLDRNGDGDTSSVIAAIERAIALKSVYNIRVINLSLGQPVTESYQDDPLCQAAEAAWKAGIVVVVAAGNDGRDNSFGNEGYGTITSPGNDPYVLTVGAMKTMGTPQVTDDLIASYSSKGPSAIDHIVKPDVVAPGNQIASLMATKSTLPLLYPNNITLTSAYKPDPSSAAVEVQPKLSNDPNAPPPGVKVGRGYSNKYMTLSGTSMAAAVVSGVVADLLQANPSLTPDQVKMLLMLTASKTFPSSSTVVDSSTGDTFVSYYDLFTVGAGYVNLPAALARIKAVPTGVMALSPTASWDQASGVVQVDFDPSSVFSDQSVWGSGSPTSNRSVWGSNSVWGSSVLVGNTAVWGERSVWGSSTGTFAERSVWGSSSGANAERSVWGSNDGDSAERSVWGSSAIWGVRSVWGSSAGPESEAITVAGEK